MEKSGGTLCKAIISSNLFTFYEVSKEITSSNLLTPTTQKVKIKTKTRFP